MPVKGHYSTISRDYDYIRHGTLSLLAGIDLTSGRSYYNIFEKPKRCDFIEYLKELESIFPEEKIVIILDNHTIHTSGETRKYLKTVLRNLNSYSHLSMLHG